MFLFKMPKIFNQIKKKINHYLIKKQIVKNKMMIKNFSIII